LFPKPKEIIKGTLFHSEAIKTAVTRELRGILLGVHRSVAEEIGKVHLSQGDYFEEDML